MRILVSHLLMLLVVAALAATPGRARANIELQVSQDVSSLFGAGSPPGPFYAAFTLNSGDGGLYNNSATIKDFGLTTGVALAGAPIVVAGNAFGDLNPNNLLGISEGTFSTPFDYTQVLQPFTVTNANATMTFVVDLSQSFVGPSSMFSHDMFTYEILYDHDGDPMTAPVPVVTTVVPGNIDFIQYEYDPNNLTVMTGGPFPGANPPPLDGIGAVSVRVIPEPASILIWGGALTALGIARYRRRKLAPMIP